MDPDSMKTQRPTTPTLPLAGIIHEIDCNNGSIGFDLGNKHGTIRIIFPTAKHAAILIMSEQA